MTKKDFELIARVLREARERWAYTPSDRSCVDALAGEFADALATTNERFDRERFIAAATKEN